VGESNSGQSQAFPRLLQTLVCSPDRRLGNGNQHFAKTTDFSRSSFWFRESTARDVEAQTAMDINLLSVGFMIFARKFRAAIQRATTGDEDAFRSS
jgi:hypothetical protein